MFKAINKANFLQYRFSQILEDMSGYKTISTFYMDFSIADTFGEKGIKETYENVMKNWSDNYKYITELYIVLNHKIWEHYENKNDKLAKLYDGLWRECGNWCDDNFTSEELEYFYATID